MEGAPTDIGIIGGFEGESEDSRLEKKSDDKMPEERSEGLGEKVLNVTELLAEKTKNEKALIASQKMLRIVELAMKSEDGLLLSDEEEKALQAEYTRESQLAKDEGYSYELFDILSGHQSFYDSNLYGDMLGQGYISVSDVVRKFGKEALEEDVVLKGMLQEQIVGILDNSSEITEQQIELLRVLKENGINIVELMARNGDVRLRMNAQSEELSKNSDYLFDALVENELLDVKDVLSSQQVLFEEYNRSNGSIVIANFLDRVIADYPDEISEEEGYWLEVAKEHGAGKLLEFAHKINEGDTSVFGEYDSNEAEVQTALFGVLKNSNCFSMEKPMAFLISKEMNVMLDDPEAVQRMLDVSEGSDRTGSSLDVLIVGNAERLDRWVEEGVFDGRPKREDSRLLKSIQDGSLTEKERLRLVFRNFILDQSIFDKDDNSIEELYHSISDVRPDRNKQYADLKLAFFRKDFQKKVIEECYATNGTISPFLHVSDEALEHAEGVSDSVRVFLRLFGGSVSDIGSKLTDIRIEDIEKYFDADGPTESFYTECLADNYSFFLQKIDANELSRIGLEPKTYYRILNNLYAEQIINVHDFASVDRKAAHAVLGDSKEVDDYLDLMSLFSDTGDYSSARRDCARAVSLDDISRYYVNGVLTKDFMEGPFKQMSLSTIGELGEKAFEGMGVSADEYRKAIKEKFYLSELVAAREILYALDKKAIKKVFSDDRRLLMYLELIDYNRNVSFGVVENISVSELPKYFTEEGKPTAELMSQFVCSGMPPSAREDLRRLNITLSDSTEMLLDGISRRQIFTDEDDKVDETNVLAALARFLRMDAYDWEGAAEDDLKVKKAFAEENIQNKNLAMKMLRREYAEFLKTGIMPSGLKCFADYMRMCDGAGPLTQIEAFLDYCGELGRVDEKTIDGIRGVEARIRKWDDQDKANYYAISAEVLKADPEIFGEFIEVFGRIKEEEDFVVFAKEIYPLFRAKLALLKEYDDYSDGIGDGSSTVNYKNVDKEKIKNDLHIALLPFSFEGKGGGEDDRAYLERRRKGIEMVKRNILGEITGLFQEKFDILPEAIPSELDDEAIRSIEDMVLYLSNVNHPDSRKKNIIGFFLALQLMKNEKGGTKWDDFRAGLSVPPTSCLGREAARSVESALSVSESKNPIKSQDIGIADEERLKDFRIALQDETSEIRVGNTSTVDARLQNISQNIRELMDPDLYDDLIDKAKIDLLRRYGSKKINSVAAKMWQRQNGKSIDFTAEEEEIASGLGQMLTENGIELSSKSINEHLQKGFKDLGMIFAAYEVIETSNIDEKVFELQDLLIPRGEILTIFQEMGEEFKPHSGVLALSADIAFLENLVAKAEKKGLLSGDIEEQRRKIALVRGYLNEAHAKFGEISRLYEELVKKFDNIKIQPIIEGGSGRDKLIAKMQEIRNIIGSRASGIQTTIVSRCSNKMTTIVENMRACLSCKTKGVNNDTDLTFGESYKFYLYSSGSVGETGSMSDEIVYFVPVEDKNGERRMSFVMDRLYGSKNRDIYYNHAATLVKKAKELKKRFPEARISVLLTASSAMSCAAKLDARRLASHIGVPQTATVVEHESLGVEIPESGFGDHYIEIDEGSAREAGRREVGGIEIIF